MTNPSPEIGDHLVSPRSKIGIPYSHHGIYIGDGNVVHYAGLSNDADADGSKIQVTPLAAFEAGHGFGIKQDGGSKFSRAEIAERARSRVGEDGYSMFANNCEHFCMWAIHGCHQSDQVDDGTFKGARLLGKAISGISQAAVGTIGASYGLSGAAGMMKATATVGSVVGGGVVAGIAATGGLVAAATAATVNRTLLADKEGHDEAEADARQIGRVASYAGAAGGTVAAVTAISAAGVPGLSAAGITSGLATVGSLVGGGMSAGIGATVAAPAVAAAAVGYGAYKVAQSNETVREKLTSAADAVADAAAKGHEFAKPVVQSAVTAATDGLKKIAEQAKDVAPTVADAAAAALGAAKASASEVLSRVRAGMAQAGDKPDSDTKQ